MILGITAALAWELPSEPINLDEMFGMAAYQMEKSTNVNRIDKNISSIQLTDKIKSPTKNFYYTNLPASQNGYYESAANKINGNWSPNDVQSNKMQYYLMYADKVMNGLKELTEKVPAHRPMQPNQLVNV